MNLKQLVVSATLVLAASAACAQDAPIPLALVTTGPNLLGTTFQRSVSGLFIDVFSFTPAAVAGTVSVTLTPLDTSINFFAALINGDSFSFFPESGATNFSFQSVVDARSPLSLTVFGYAGDASNLTDASGRYSGSIQVQTVAAVPEPETYALLLAGLATLGALKQRSSRRKEIYRTSLSSC